MSFRPSGWTIFPDSDSEYLRTLNAVKGGSLTHFIVLAVVGTVIYSSEARIQKVNRKCENGKRQWLCKWVIDSDPLFLRLQFQSTTHFSRNNSNAGMSTTKDKVKTQEKRQKYQKKTKMSHLKNCCLKKKSRVNGMMNNLKWKVLSTTAKPWTTLEGHIRHVVNTLLEVVSITPITSECCCVNLTIIN